MKVAKESTKPDWLSSKQFAQCSSCLGQQLPTSECLGSSSDSLWIPALCQLWDVPGNGPCLWAFSIHLGDTDWHAGTTGSRISLCATAPPPHYQLLFIKYYALAQMETCICIFLYILILNLFSFLLVLIHSTQYGYVHAALFSAPHILNHILIHLLMNSKCWNQISCNGCKIAYFLDQKQYHY